MTTRFFSVHVLLNNGQFVYAMACWGNGNLLTDGENVCMSKNLDGATAFRLLAIIQRMTKNNSTFTQNNYDKDLYTLDNTIRW